MRLKDPILKDYSSFSSLKMKDPSIFASRTFAFPHANLRKRRYFPLFYVEDRIPKTRDK